ncbi:hypothetical protein [Bacillus horti]|uniref:hypothetical protein n=1 Tax=Caldalkalibacillus horti TaxID=77523 RepID=UPI0027D7C5E8|nr:hypothetical protein [Bacillus horti]
MPPLLVVCTSCTTIKLLFNPILSITGYTNYNLPEKDRTFKVHCQELSTTHFIFTLLRSPFGVIRILIRSAHQLSEMLLTLTFLHHRVLC